MNAEFAHLWAIHKERSSERIVQIDLAVHYCGRAVRFPIHLLPAIDGSDLRGPVVARELTLLGEALIRIAQQPESMIDENPPVRLTEPSDRRVEKNMEPRSGE